MKPFLNNGSILTILAQVTLLAGVSLAPRAVAAVEQVPGKVKFSVAVDSPAALSSCAGSVWAYSARNRELLRLNPGTGAVAARTALPSIGIQGHVLALGCTGNSLLVAVQKRQGLSERSYALYQAPIPTGAAKPGQAKTLPMPGTGLVRDVFCRPNSHSCILIRDRVYKTGNLKNWSDAQVPLSKDIPFDQTKKQENPFVDWQDQFMIASGQYFRGEFLPDTAEPTLALLDPLRVSIVTHGAGRSEKWGRWGVWEGRMMSPKGIAFVAGPSGGFFAISDVGLKLVFVFSREGRYLGSLGADGAAARFNYPLDLIAIGNVIYVADFGASKVSAYEIQPALPVEKPVDSPLKGDIDQKMEELLRKNFFRDPEILKARARTRCLMCHDGLQINSLDKFMEQGKHHPINVTMKAGKIDLPLEAGNTVTCSTCHDAHHGVAAGPAQSKAPKQHPYMLRKAVKELCSTCHTGYSAPERNHVVTNPAEACADCHSMHVSQDYLLKEKLPNLCLDCHGADKVPGGHPFSADMGVTCVSCHSLHDSAPKLSFAAHAKFAATGKGETRSTCFTCHEDKKALVGKSYHMGTEPQNSHPWPKDEGMCLDCHAPHAKPRPVKEVCAQCHSDIKGGHPVSVEALAGTPAAKGIVLQKGKSITCMTCHEPHGGTPPNEDGRNFFRPAPAILEFCAGCHGDKAADVYKTFHSRGGKK